MSKVEVFSKFTIVKVEILHYKNILLQIIHQLPGFHGSTQSQNNNNNDITII